MSASRSPIPSRSRRLIEGRVDAAWARWVRPWALTAWCGLTDRHRDGQLVGLLRARLGRLVVLGPGRERLLHALAARHGAAALGGRRRKAREPAALDRPARDPDLRHEPDRHLPGALGRLDLGPFLRGRPDARRLYPDTDRRRDRRRPCPLRLARAGARSRRPFAPVSREGALCSTISCSAAGMATVFLGTFYPLFAEVWSGDKLSVGPQYFDTTFVPIVVPASIAMVIGPVLAWRRGNLTAALRRLAPALVGALLAPADRVRFRPRRLAGRARRHGARGLGDARRLDRSRRPRRRR